MKPLPSSIQYAEYGDLRYAVYVPSRRRETTILSLPPLRYANVFVAEEEMDNYAAAFHRLEAPPVALIPHAEKGLINIHNYACDMAFADPRCQFVLSFDDDVLYLMAMMTRGAAYRIDNPVEFMAIMLQIALVGYEMGAAMANTTRNASPVARSALSPFSLRSWSGGPARAVMNRGIRQDTNLTFMEDIDISLQSVSLTGLSPVDNRFHPVVRTSGQGMDKGGLANSRTAAAHDKNLAYLVEKWGSDVIVVRDEKDRGGLTRFTVNIPK